MIIASGKSQGNRRPDREAADRRAGVGYLYEPEETGISHLTGYGATAAVSLGAPGLVRVEGCGLFTYVHTVKEDRMTHQHNLPASYCLTVGL